MQIVSGGDTPAIESVVLACTALAWSTCYHSSSSTLRLGWPGLAHKAYRPAGE